MRHHHSHRRHSASHKRHTAHDTTFAWSGRGTRRRLFHTGELRLVLLKLIEEQPRHGYDLMREAEARSGGAYVPSPGVVYPTITLLIDMGLIDEVGQEPGRKLFAISETGRAHLAEHAAEVKDALARLQALADIRERTDAAPIARAMENLKNALHNRISGRAAKAIMFEVASVIDEAASKIERL
jgi:DNA-binding PadR family transcriptional regulator